MKQPKLFSYVKCVAYLKKIRDGVHIILSNPDGSSCESNYACSPNCKAIAIRYDSEKGENVEIKDLSDFDGSCVKKVYRKRIETEFKGVVVGYTTVKMSGIIGTDWKESHYGEDYGYCYKQAVDVPKVAVVYFKNNCKRYVLLDDLEQESE